MEEFLLWIMVILKVLKHLFPFLVGALFTFVAYKLIGLPFKSYLILIALVMVLMIGLDIRSLFKDFFK